MNLVTVVETMTYLLLGLSLVGPVLVVAFACDGTGLERVGDELYSCTCSRCQPRRRDR
jgi:hypothetical protein